MELTTFASYEHYLKAQKATEQNRSKGPFHKVSEIEILSKWLQSKQCKKGICHGARCGTECVRFMQYLPDSKVIGTDLRPRGDLKGRNESALYVEEWDFSKMKPEWINSFDFVYSNSLDHAYNPFDLLRTWMMQVRIGGHLCIEWSHSHLGREGGDCFGAGLHEYIDLLNQVGEVVEVLTCPRVVFVVIAERTQ